MITNKTIKMTVSTGVIYVNRSSSDRNGFKFLPERFEIGADQDWFWYFSWELNDSDIELVKKELANDK